jgi:predicted nucleotidyltransferase
MARTQPGAFPFPPKRLFRGANIPMRLIHRYARAIAAEFHPDQIILFGSYGYGTPHEDSDVDLLVVMPARNQHDQAARIRWRLAAPFPVDLIVRTPQQMSWRLAEGESFLTAIVSKGKVLYGKEKRAHPILAQDRSVWVFFKFFSLKPTYQGISPISVFVFCS